MPQENLSRCSSPPLFTHPAMYDDSWLNTNSISKTDKATRATHCNRRNQQTFKPPKCKAKIGKKCPFKKSPYLSTSKQRDFRWESGKKNERLPVSALSLGTPMSQKNTNYIRFRSLVTVWSFWGVNSRALSHEKANGTDCSHFRPIFHMEELRPGRLNPNVSSHINPVKLRNTTFTATVKSMPPSHIGHIFMKPILQDNDWLSKPSNRN